MAKGQWRHSDDQVAIEAFAVLMQRRKPTRTMTKADLIRQISKPEIYKDFLQLCMEYDDSKDLEFFRRGLMIVIQAVGVSMLAEETGLSRLGIYKMLSKSGNPRLSSLLKVIEMLGTRLWLVDEDFIRRRQKVVRPKDLLVPLPVTKRSSKSAMSNHRKGSKPAVVIRRPARQD